MENTIKNNYIFVIVFVLMNKLSSTPNNIFVWAKTIPNLRF